jgi:hypothetical protein
MCTKKKMLDNLKNAKQIYGREVVADIIRRALAKGDRKAILQFNNIMEKGELDLSITKNINH